MDVFYNESTGPVILRRCRLLDEAGAVHAFTTRQGGFSRGYCEGFNMDVKRDEPPGSVRKNREMLGGLLGFDINALAVTNQVHKDVIRTVRPEDMGPEGVPDYECDGLVTDIAGSAVMCFSADCIPVLLWDPVRRAAAAVHSGWRGTAMGIAATAVRAMESRFGCSPGDIVAALGPGIGPCCFETHDDVPERMAELGDFSRRFISPRGEKWSVDLKGIIASTLENAGVKKIASDSLCTCCEGGLFWSNRRDGNNRGNQAAVIALV